MKKLVSTRDLTEEEWLAWRRHGIGGSDASIIMGCNPYRSKLDLWDDKCGNKEVKVTGNTFTYFGNLMEPIVRKEFKKRTGLQVRQKHCILQSEKYPWMLADLDGVIREEDGSYAVFEAKTANEFKRGEWEHKVPDEYYAQIQHYLVVTGYKRAYIAAFVGGNSYYCHVVDRNEEYIGNLIELEREFWECVQNGVRPAVDASEATSKYLNEKYSISEQSEVDLPESAETIISDYKQVDMEIKKLTEKKNGISNQLKEMLQQHEVGKVGEHIITWTPVVRKSLDSSQIKLLLKDKYDSYLKETRYRKLSVA